MSKLKLVLLLGKGKNLSEETKALYKEEDDNVIIGDGESLITDAQFASLLGRVDSGTRFDILASGYFCTQNEYRHLVDLFENDHYPIPLTQDPLERIAGLLEGKPVEVHIWSGFSAAQTDLIRLLPAGSVLITHDPHTKGVIDHLVVNNPSYFPADIGERFKILNSNNQVESAISEAFNKSIPAIINAGKKPSERLEVLDYNKVVATAHLGAATGLHIAVKVPEGSKPFTELDFRAIPRDEGDTSGVKSFLELIRSSVHSALSKVEARSDNVVSPTDLEQFELSVGEISSFTNTSKMLPEMIEEAVASTDATGVASSDSIFAGEAASSALVSTTTKLKFVLFLGPGLKLSAELIEAYNSEDSIIIGNGESLITQDQLDSLKGRVDSSTRFDIHGHGSVRGYQRHLIELFEESLSTHQLSKDVMKKINDLVGGKPVEVNLWSCFGSAEMGIVSELAKGSILISHAPADLQTIAEVCNKGIIDSIKARKVLDTSGDSLNYDLVLKTAHIGSESELHVAINVPSGVNQYTILDFSEARGSILTDESSIKGLFTSIAQAIYASISSSEMPAGIMVPSSLPTLEFSAEEIDAFKQTSLLCHAGLFKTELAEVALQIKGDERAQAFIVDHIVKLEDISTGKLLSFLKSLQEHGVNITHFFTEDGELGNMTKSQIRSELDKVADLAEELSVDEVVQTNLETSYASVLAKETELENLQARLAQSQVEAAEAQARRQADLAQIAQLETAIAEQQARDAALAESYRQEMEALAAQAPVPETPETEVLGCCVVM